MKKMTPKQEAFAQLVAGGVNQSDAYRQAYNTSRMKAATVNREAKALIDNPKIATRVDEIRAPVIEKVRYYLEDAMMEAEQARQLALADPKGAAAAVAATALKSRLNGLYEKDNSQHGDAAIRALMEAVGKNAAKFEVKQ